MKKKQKILIVIGIIVGILSVTGVSFALWSKTFFQTGDNTIASDCFQIVFLESSGTGINLENSFPMFDSDGKRLTPYTFSITNTCDSAVEYQLNLETTNQTTMKDSYIKVMLNEETPALLSSKTSTTPTITNGKSAYILESGTLSGNTKNEYTLRIWMDENVTQNDEGAMNSLFESKITITGSYITSQQPLKEYGIKEFVIAKGTGLYEVNHETASITSNLTEEQKANLKKTEYRYAGSNPNNYVEFNDELWRIIGLVNTPEGQRLKLVRDESIGSYSWDTSDININGGRGVNEWSQADVMTLLNQGPYYQQSSGTCYNGQNNATTPCDFTATGLTEKAKTMIDTITWNIGSDAEENWTSSNIHLMYNYERSNNVGKKCSMASSCNDTVERTTLWSGNVGLIYPSDYGYATSGGQTITKETCQNIGFGNWIDSDKKDCSENDWLFSSKAVWTITPHVMNDTAYNGFNVNPIGSVSRNNVYNSFEILPSIYLQTNIKIVEGEGTKNNPYQLRKEEIALPALATEVIQNTNLVNTGSGLYVVSHETASITSDLTEEQKANLKKTEYRYAGSNPNNYVKFNDELWRIIGLVNTPEGQRIKLIRNEPIGAYAWDSSENSINDGWGVNEWSQAKVMTLLNYGAYWNRMSGTCYRLQNLTTKACDFSNTGLSSEAKKMIDTVTWNLGTNGSFSASELVVSQFYDLERSNNHGKICNENSVCNDVVTRTMLWKGNVGLMYPSDYFYATSGKNQDSRKACFTSLANDWNAHEDCYSNNWIYDSTIYQWTMMPYANVNNAIGAFNIRATGEVRNVNLSYGDMLRPVIYLVPESLVIDGNGSIDFPYLLRK